MAIGSADNDIIDCTDIAEFYCWPGFPSTSLANRESRSSWKDFLLGLRRRGLNGVEFVVADDHAGLRMAIREVLPEAAFQQCYVHFLRNALDHLPRLSGSPPR
jgi:transposase-like protein